MGRMRNAATFGTKAWRAFLIKGFRLLNGHARVKDIRPQAAPSQEAASSAQPLS